MLLSQLGATYERMRFLPGFGLSVFEHGLPASVPDPNCQAGGNPAKIFWHRIKQR
jgi:hypothetical protein